jgi:hypothetical protein
VNLFFVSLRSANRSYSGDILKFLREKAQSAGLAYSGGTGRYEERIKMMTLAKKKAEFEREHGCA